MTTSRFLKTWIPVTLASLALNITSVQWWEGTPDETRVLVAGTLFFAILCVGLFFLAGQMVARNQSGTFMGLFFISILIKFSGAVALLFAYQSKFGPVPKTVMGVFILTYVIFLVYETWFMMILGKQEA